MAVSQASSTVRTQEEPIGRTIREGAPSLAPSRIQQNRQEADHRRREAKREPTPEATQPP
ncbi:hypothetical protein EDB81DRAFT_814730 [Dactylonectria macrodidyma]|uniref:Uncharacterized protein n=1 Tax=Dactylonectria macrodidyma TaxID=307937 RepID=A0A9P9DHT3_9HYPO|nr:hypothetical protein EDB81DRAFT_814730 [Dactylonectria macrodidyma]